jgi:hypothetical protein
VLFPILSRARWWTEESTKTTQTHTHTLGKRVRIEKFESLFEILDPTEVKELLHPVVFDDREVACERVSPRLPYDWAGWVGWENSEDLEPAVLGDRQGEVPGCPGEDLEEGLLDEVPIRVSGARGLDVPEVEPEVPRGRCP